MTRQVEHKVDFRDAGFAPVHLAHGANLSEHLDVGNSPLLFGCRTGICGTCLVQLEGNVSPPSEDEQELLDVLAPGDTNARLACQVSVIADISVRPYPDAG